MPKQVRYFLHYLTSEGKGLPVSAMALGPGEKVKPLVRARREKFAG
jgi:hypothetical protein